ncbi:hypothetical protein K432DRAFT_97674 [Lepidopterella palustris CBS 459.81]|uniref:Uncharacterized protein n=1 Tax=Lepidopterella palustris CBS 459.81 TaxID=1314670 RepID=A0A8E2JD48_9PEZI|nr:hypothetical protein K432DRAFT_97674 [Lepidopterella palustris CBS 459.81]
MLFTQHLESLHVFIADSCRVYLNPFTHDSMSIFNSFASILLYSLPFFKLLWISIKQLASSICEVETSEFPREKLVPVTQSSVVPFVCPIILPKLECLRFWRKSFSQSLYSTPCFSNVIRTSWSP